MFVHKNIGPLKVKGKVLCRFMVGKPVPEVALKHWGEEGVKSLLDAKVIGKEMPKNESVRQDKSGQQENSKPGVLGSSDSNKQGGNNAGSSGSMGSDKPNV